MLEIKATCDNCKSILSIKKIGSESSIEIELRGYGWASHAFGDVYCSKCLKINDVKIAVESWK